MNKEKIQKFNELTKKLNDAEAEKMRLTKLLQKAASIMLLWPEVFDLAEQGADPQVYTQWHVTGRKVMSFEIYYIGDNGKASKHFSPDIVPDILHAKDQLSLVFKR